MIIPAADVIIIFPGKFQETMQGIVYRMWSNSKYNIEINAYCIVPFRKSIKQQIKLESP